MHTTSTDENSEMQNATDSATKHGAEDENRTTARKRNTGDLEWPAGVNPEQFG